MSDSIKNIVEKIQDSQKAQIKLTKKDGKQVYLDCVFKESNAPQFFLLFRPNKLPENIDLNKKHPVSVRYQKTTISLSSNIVSTPGDRSLELVANTMLDPASMREYFRVDVTTSISASYEVKSNADHPRNWSMTGTTQDLSATGVRALFPEEPKDIHHIFLKIHIPDTHLIVRALAHVVRKKKLRKERWQVSFHFDDLTDDHRDQVIQCCLREQRKQLREKVQTIY